MDKIPTEITFSFIPLAWQDEEDGQYHPSVKVLVNGEFREWKVIRLGFSEPRFVMPYANQLAQAMKQQYTSMVGIVFNNRR